VPEVPPSAWSACTLGTPDTVGAHTVCSLSNRSSSW
jgi:hypothetical protein